MSNHIICFCGEIKKKISIFRLKKVLSRFMYISRRCLLSAHGIMNSIKYMMPNIRDFLYY